MSAAAMPRATSWVHVPGSGPTPPTGRVGGKGHHLERLAAIAGPAAGFEVPRFVVVTSDAFEAMRGGAPWPASKEQARALAAALRTTPLPRALVAELDLALETAGLSRARVAVRSSAAAEDGATKSFAGQFDTVLGVRLDQGREPLWDALRRVWASALNPHAAAYGAGAVRMAVVIQEVVESEVSGVAFSVDPLTGARDVAAVSAVYGLGEGLVSGELDADEYRVHFGALAPRVEARVADKPRATRMTHDSETSFEPVAHDLRRARALSDREAIAVAASARAVAEAFGAPQDVEWALSGATRRLALLQARPITALPDAPPPAAPGPSERRVWDNSNIVESYSGVTTPLTFSFAREVYESVYRQFCRLMGTEEALLESHQEVFAHMLGLVRGRVYYNLLNWYRTLALLPGFQWNRGFMERMMGVREALEDPPAPPSAGGRLKDFVSLVRMLLRMIREAGRLDREVPAFHTRVERAIGPLRREDVTSWPAERALALYHRLERDLLEQWRPPLVNDFFAMIFFGVLGRITERWVPDAPPTLVNDLLCGEGGIVSTEPARRVMALARTVAAAPALQQHFAAETDDRELLARLTADPGAAPFVAELRAYLEAFGDRCMEELKLETVTLGEDPAFLIAMIRAYAAQGTVDPDAAWQRERAIRHAAEARVFERLTGPKRAVYRWVLIRTRRRVRDRENLRFERTRVFGVVRRIVLALGRHLASIDRLREPRDVFYLTRQELFSHFDGTSTIQDWRALVALRRAEFERFAAEPAPPDRFETRGPLAEWEPPAAAASGAAEADVLQGTGCCPGVVRAPVRVVRDPRTARDLGGAILVAERTDPGWTLLFPAVRGLLVQRGSLLSHSAIVAREMGLPCVVGIAGLLDALRDGETVEMDGTTGLVRRLERGTPS